jgi:predicted Zn-dependent protease
MQNSTFTRALLRRLAPLALACAGVACKGANMYTVHDDVTMGAQAFEEIKSDKKINRIESGPIYDQVQRVTDRIVESALEIDPEISSLFEWEIVVLDADETVNAFCLPGGKMAVYTGILPVAGNDAGLAVVIGHEIAHATRRHGTQRATHSVLTGIGIEIFTEGAEFSTDKEEREIATVLAEVGLGLPFSRDHELEADRIGLIYMATAGYDPREAVGFWQRMSAGGGGAPPEWLSTHPSDTTRIQKIQSMLPEVLPLYEAALISDS